VLWNAGAERLYGYAATDVIGQPLSMLIPPDRWDELSILLDRVQQGERIQGYQARRLRRDGTSVDVALTISPVRDEAGDASAIVTISPSDDSSRRASRPRRTA
jgi:PAS domain S-box-containing protein